MDKIFGGSEHNGHPITTQAVCTELTGDDLKSAYEHFRQKFRGPGGRPLRTHWSDLTRVRPASSKENHSPRVAKSGGIQKPGGELRQK